MSTDKELLYNLVFERAKVGTVDHFMTLVNIGSVTEDWAARVIELGIPVIEKVSHAFVDGLTEEEAQVMYSWVSCTSLVNKMQGYEDALRLEGLVVQSQVNEEFRKDSWLAKLLNLFTK